jgi:hypothetical protein
VENRVCIICGVEAYLYHVEWFCREHGPQMVKAVWPYYEGKKPQGRDKQVYDFINEVKHGEKYDGSKPRS